MKRAWAKWMGFVVVLVAAVSAIAGMAVAEKPVKVIAGNLEGIFNGGFTPKAISKTKPTPLTFYLSAKLRTLDGTHPPAMREFILEGDKYGFVDVEGIPTCKSGQLQSRDSEAARKACGPALIGSGKTAGEVQFPEQKPILLDSELLAFNGGVKGGVTTLFIHAYLSAPVTAAVVTTVKIKRVSKGRYGLESIATIPKIAGGSGSVTSFNLTLKKGIVSAICPDGHLNARGTAIFEDTTRLKGGVVRGCTPKG